MNYIFIKVLFFDGAFFVTKNNIKNIHKVMFENINQSNNERD